MKTILEQFREEFVNDGFVHDVNGPIESKEIENFLTTIKDQMIECVGENVGQNVIINSIARGEKEEVAKADGYNQAKAEIRQAIISKFGE